jgi:serine/threonine protein phosphatase 1
MAVGRVLVVGDMHGCIDELDRLLEALSPGRDDTVCCLGDYIDRGPAAQAVITRLLRLRDEGPECVFLKGNHEDMFLAFLGYPGHYGESFFGNGGVATLASYGLERLSGREVRERLPEDHREFLLALRTEARFDGFLCVHAGVRPTVPLDQQSDEDLLWIREGFIDRPHAFPFVVVFGHTPRRDVYLDLPYKIGLDTGLIYGNRLSCLELRSGALHQIERGSREVRKRSIARELVAAGILPA